MKLIKKSFYVCFCMYVRPRRKDPVQIFLEEYYKAYIIAILNNPFIFCEQRPLSVKFNFKNTFLDHNQNLKLKLFIKKPPIIFGLF